MLIDSTEMRLLKAFDMLSEDAKLEVLRRLDELLEEQVLESACCAAEKKRHKITVSCNMLSDEI